MKWESAENPNVFGFARKYRYNALNMSEKHRDKQ